MSLESELNTTVDLISRPPLPTGGGGSAILTRGLADGEKILDSGGEVIMYRSAENSFGTTIASELHYEIDKLSDLVVDANVETVVPDSAGLVSRLDVSAGLTSLLDVEVQALSNYETVVLTSGLFDSVEIASRLDTSIALVSSSDWILTILSILNTILQ
jgi:hypothetical protein